MPRTPKAGEACLQTIRSLGMLLTAEDPPQADEKHGTPYSTAYSEDSPMNARIASMAGSRLVR